MRREGKNFARDEQDEEGFVAMLNYVIIDWLYYLTTAFIIGITSWLVYFVIYELDPVNMLNSTISFIDDHFWHTVCFVGVEIFAFVKYR